jgi:hypothetical protein
MCNRSGTGHDVRGPKTAHSAHRQVVVPPATGVWSSDIAYHQTLTCRHCTANAQPGPILSGHLASKLSFPGRSPRRGNVIAVFLRISGHASQVAETARSPVHSPRWQTTHVRCPSPGQENCWLTCYIVTAFDHVYVNQDHRPGPDRDRMLVAELTGTTRHHARWRELAQDEQDAAVTELREQVGCEEVARQDRLGLGAQELRPGRVCSSRRGVDPGLLQISHTVDAAIFAPRPTNAGSCPVTSSRSPWRRTFGITANNVARKCPIRPVQVRAARLPPLQDGELVAQDQDLCGLPGLLMPDSRSHEDARVISR